MAHYNYSNTYNYGGAFLGTVEVPSTSHYVLHQSFGSAHLLCGAFSISRGGKDADF